LFLLPFGLPRAVSPSSSKPVSTPTLATTTRDTFQHQDRLLDAFALLAKFD